LAFNDVSKHRDNPPCNFILFFYVTITLKAKLIIS